MTVEKPPLIPFLANHTINLRKIGASLYLPNGKYLDNKIIAALSVNLKI